MFLKWERLAHVLTLLGRQTEGKIDKTRSLEVGGKRIHSTDGEIGLIWTMVHFSHVAGGIVERMSKEKVKMMNLETGH